MIKDDTKVFDRRLEGHQNIVQGKKGGFGGLELRNEQDPITMIIRVKNLIFDRETSLSIICLSLL